MAISINKSSEKSGTTVETSQNYVEKKGLINFLNNYNYVDSLLSKNKCIYVPMR